MSIWVSVRRSRRRLRGCLTAAAFAALSLASGGARAQAQAQDANAGANPEPLEDAGCVKTYDTSARTNELFRRALTAWEAGKTDAAVSALREAHAISSCAVFSFILGELKLEEHEDCEALRWFQRYLHDNPSGQKSEQARTRLAELGPRCAAKAASPPSVAPAATAPVATVASSRAANAPAAASPPTPAASYWTGARVGGWSSVGLGALLGVTAVVYAARAADATGDYERLWAGAANDPAHWQQRREELEQRGSSSASTARVLGVAGAALAVGGTVLLLLAPSTQLSPTHDVALTLRPEAWSADYCVRF